METEQTNTTEVPEIHYRDFQVEACLLLHPETNVGSD